MLRACFEFEECSHLGDYFPDNKHQNVLDAKHRVSTKTCSRIIMYKISDAATFGSARVTAQYGAFRQLWETMIYAKILFNIISVIRWAALPSHSRGTVPCLRG